MHIVKPVEDVLGKPVIFLKETIGKETQQVVENSLPGQIILLENLRYHKEEEEGNNDFAKELSRLGDSYVNDAFGTAHRATLLQVLLQSILQRISLQETCF